MGQEYELLDTKLDIRMGEEENDVGGFPRHVGEGKTMRSCWSCVKVGYVGLSYLSDYCSLLLR
jgi:hypothetical protein